MNAKYKFGIIISVIFFVILAIAGISLSIYWSDEDEVVRNFNEHQLSIVRQTANRMDSYLETRAKFLQVLSSLPSFQSGNKSKIQNDIKLYYRYLKYRFIDEISFLSENGTVIFSTNNKLSGLDFSSIEYWRSFKTGIKPESTDTSLENITLKAEIIYDSTELYPKLLLIKPLFHNINIGLKNFERNHLFGAVALTINLKRFLESQLNIFEYSKDKHQLLLIDSTHRILFPFNYVETNVQKPVQIAKCENCHKPGPSIVRVLDESEGLLKYDINGFNKISAFKKLSFHNIGWTVVVTSPYDQVMAFNKGIFNKTIVIFSIIIILLIVGIIVFFRYYSSLISVKLRLAAVVEQTHELIFITNKEGVFEYVNPAFEKITGYRKDEVLGKTPRILKSGKYDQDHYKNFWQFLLSGKIYYGFMIDKKKSGELFHVEERIVPLVNKNGDITNFVEIGRDITDKVLHEEQLKHLASFPELNPNPIVEFSYTKGISYINPAAANLFPDLTKSGLKHVFIEGFESISSELIDGKKKLFNREVQVGDSFYEQIIYYIISNEVFRIFASDISERRLTEKALKESEENYRTIFDSVNEAIFVLDCNSGKILDVNQRACEMTAYSRCELIGMEMPDLFLNESQFQRSEVLKRFKMTIESDPQTIEGLFKEKTGKQIYVEVNLRKSMIGGKGRILAIVHDITERKETEKYLRESEKRYRNLVELSPLAIAVLNEDRILFVNKAGANLLGETDPANFVGKPILDIIYRDYVDFYKNNKNKMDEGKEVIGKEIKLVRLDGEVIDVEFSATLASFGSLKAIQIVARDITVSKKAELALRESEERFRLVADYTYNWEYWIGLDGKFIYVSPSCKSFTGYENTDFYDDPELLRKLIHPDDRNDILPHLDSELENEKVEYLEFRIVTRKGSEIWIGHICQPVYASDGTSLGRRASNRDITQLKRSEMELIKINRALRTLSASNIALMRAKDEIELLQNVCRIIVEVGGYRFAWVGYVEQKEFEKIVRPVAYAGYEEGYLDNIHISWSDSLMGNGPVGRSIRTRKHSIIRDIKIDPDITPWKEESIKRGYNSIIALPLTGSGINPQGVLAIYASEVDAFDEEEINLLIELSNNLIYGIFSLRNRVERERAEHKIREQAALLDITQDAILVQDLNDHIIFWNKGAERYYKWTTEEAIGKNASVLLFKSIPPVLKDAKNILLIKGEWRGELNQISKDSMDVIVESHWSLVLDENSKPKSILVINNDITEKKLLEKQFLHSQRMDSLGKIAGGVAHDFNNMLAAIISSTEIVDIKAKDNEEIRKYIGIIKQASNRGADLARQLLAFARLDTYSIQPMNLNDVVLETVKLVEHTFQKTIEIKANLKNDLPLIDGDSGRLGQVFLNLCVNARDAMMKGGLLKIETSVEEISEKFIEKPVELPVGKYIQVTFTDNGMGMDEQTKQHIFEPFFTTKTKGKGTGLGLSIVYGVIQSHKGFISVESSPGIGTTFNLFFPISEFQPMIINSTKKDEIVEGTETIMIVDDEKIILELGKELLTGLKYKVITVNSGEEAVKLYKNKYKEISIVVLDILMPKMNGEETYIHLKRINPDIKTIVASGFHDPEIRKRLENQGINIFLQKPFKLAEISRAIRKILAKE